MERNLRQEIEERLDQFTATERRAALALLSTYPLLGLATVAGFAKDSGVSPPTILRFVSRLGFSSYAEFQTRLRSELQTQLSTPLARSSMLSDEDTGAGDPFVDQLLSNLRDTFASLPRAEIEAFVRLLADERKTLHLIGGRFTDALARYMAAHLRIVRPNVLHVAGQHGNWLDQLIGLGVKDVVVIFDIRRYQTEIIHFAEAAADQGATVALITDSWRSPIARVAAHVLPAQVAVPSPWDSSTALMAIAEMLIAGVTRLNPERSRTRMKALEELRNAHDPLRRSPDQV
ncbi:MurR/RpiR family transcriptional regulator [Roseibium aestuarii]|uniref:MurR/RpiR family transcriptional regulator n=1 Tax=Roseibium aestuarii TaxID=2600299 RepID=A0ABW4JV35_9HYPH|nr:MurR/RpiR family transcriptional regulator [Roseibium aestuarii]